MKTWQKFAFVGVVLGVVGVALIPLLLAQLFQATHDLQGILKEVVVWMLNYPRPAELIYLWLLPGALLVLSFVVLYFRTLWKLFQSDPQWLTELAGQLVLLAFLFIGPWILKQFLNLGLTPTASVLLLLSSAIALPWIVIWTLSRTKKRNSHPTS